MGDYVRTTRECTLSDMQPALAAAIRDHLAKYNLEELENAVLYGCETTSTARKKGLFRRQPEVIQTAVLLTPGWLLLATGKVGEEPGVLSARLAALRVQDYEQSSMYNLIADTGVNIFGLTTGTSEPGSLFIGLGPEPAAQKLRQLLKEALTGA
ncbi:MAG: hypothetical protein KDE59_24180 [Anaerolineales bacterium]|nr:hypothetical protein [Anaerolineales bacterium]MCB0011502.1 hypothetical protein [Anaerolineales bacterium]